MKTLSLATAFGLIVGPPLALAEPLCNGITVTSAGSLGFALEGQTVCVGSAGNWENQEYHHGGFIDEFKKGTNDPVDPSVTNYGSYIIEQSGGHDTIKYTYGTTTFQKYMVGIIYPNIYYCDDTTVDGMDVTPKVYGTLKLGPDGCD